ncbi:uncharacterized protein LOC131949386 isoform X1 [Physella acuta]|uniref:uncharacterized protein LOC131949386 isoform X1 n=1 Tax=Physella acuta TaxID=109671 RepID=UPI0027DE3611|nr:uncharacterized protein LOC131949386 isoform X1 [Physella acuta]
MYGISGGNEYQGYFLTMFLLLFQAIVAMSSEPIVLETNGSNNTNVVASEGDPINIVCTSSNWTALNKGKITLDCPHSIINSTQIGRGTAIRVEFRADRKMDEQHCTCAATLLDTHTTVQNFTKVASLNILNNVKTNDVNEVPEDVIVVIVCKTSGNPAPTARLYFVTEKEKTLVYQSTTRQLEYQTPAQCYRAGRYVCEAENNFSKDSKHTDLWIKCPPELCSGQTSRPVYQVPVNQNFSTSLCVLYWPRHPLGSELRQVSADNSSVESRRLDHHVTVVSRDMRQTIVNLTIFSGPDHQLGEVNLTIEYTWEGSPACTSS